MSIALIGLPGSGKSTLGRLLARQLAVQFADTDALVEARCGVPIRALFESEGEIAFRDLEESVFAEAAARLDTVVATGGGLVLRASNRALLRARFTIVYLRATARDLYDRTRNDVRRPLLQVPDRLARLSELFGERDPLYRELADITVDVFRSRPERSVRFIVSELRRRAGDRSPDEVEASPSDAADPRAVLSDGNRTSNG